MKRLTLFLLLTVLILSVAAAMASQADPEAAARSVVPASAELLRTRTEDGLLECYFRTPDGSLYEVNIDPADTRVVRVEMDAADQRGGASVDLTPEEAEAVLLTVYPQAIIHLVQQERDDGRHHYELHFSTDVFLGHAEVNAETGALMEIELDYTTAARVQGEGPLTAEQAKALALSLVEGGRIVEFESDREDGRSVYEGKVRTDSSAYEFTIDAETGRVTEWEHD